MAFKDLLSRRRIKKIVDPGMGDTPLARQPEVEALRQVVPTNQILLNQDLEDAAVEARDLVASTIQELESLYLDVPVFNALATELRSRALDLQQLDVNPAYSPVRNLSDTQVWALQRTVYEQMVDPRAPFLWDLWNILNELETLIWILRKGWRKLDNLYQRLFGAPPSDASTDSPNQSQVKPTRSMRLSHHLDMQRVRQLRFETERIKYKTHQPLRKEFLESLTMSLADWHQASGQNGHQLCRMLDMLLQDQLLELSDDHQQVQSAINASYGDWRDYVGQRLNMMLPHAVLSTTMDPIIKFTVHLENLADREDMQVRDFRQQVENALLQHSTRVEDDLLDREKAAVQHARNLLHANVEKAGVLKQYIETIRASRAVMSDTVKDGSVPELAGTYLRSAQGALDTFYTQKLRPFLQQVNNVQKILDSIKLPKRT